MARSRHILLFLLLLLFGARLSAQAAMELGDATRRLATATAEMARADRTLSGKPDEETRDRVREQVTGARADANAVAVGLQTELARVDARIAQLGPAETAETADLRTQRALLAHQRTALDSAIKRGRLLDIEAQQLLDEIGSVQAEQIGERIARRTPSPLSPAFWTRLLSSAPRDLDRGTKLVTGETAQVLRQLNGTVPWTAAAGLIVAVLLLFPARLALRRFGRDHMIRGVPGHRVRRSGYALWRVLVGTALPGLAALIFVQGLRWSGLVSERIAPLADALVIGAFISAFVNSLAGSLLLRGQSSWRLLILDDDTAQRLRPWSWLLTGLALVIPCLDAFTRAAGASSTGATAIVIVEVLAYLFLLGGTLLTIGRLRASTSAETPTRAGVAFVTLAAWIAVLVATLALTLGYVGLARFVVRSVSWASVVAAALYLLLTAADDVATTVFSGRSRFGETLHRGLGLRPATIDQFGVLLSGAVRLLLVLLAVATLLDPFGSNVGSFFGRLGAFRQGITVGALSVSPWSIARAILVFVIGLGMVKLFGRWLNGRYLPTTELDGSARNSVSLVARYVGLILAVLWALASLGIGMERIALLLSALSVGIGFGLQAITQNFVSGLILLAERPVKIGDLVRIGNDEGDVKRISVRSTEIELGDHSTLIVPNSELITKTVLNKTLASPLGRIQLTFSVPIGVDAGRVRDILLRLYRENGEVLDDPAPSVFIDGLAENRILFNSFAHVSSPRAAYGARSAVLFALLARLTQEGIDIGTVPQRIELAGGTLPHAGQDRDRQDGAEAEEAHGRN